jgi:hypothetical protein
MYILCLYEAVFISLVLTLGKKGLECVVYNRSYYTEKFEFDII